MELEFEYTTRISIVCDPEKGNLKEGTRDSLNIVSIRLGGPNGLLVSDKKDSDEKRVEIEKIEAACWREIDFLR